MEFGQLNYEYTGRPYSSGTIQPWVALAFCCSCRGDFSYLAEFPTSVSTNTVCSVVLCRHLISISITAARSNVRITVSLVSVPTGCSTGMYYTATCIRKGSASGPYILVLIYSITEYFLSRLGGQKSPYFFISSHQVSSQATIQ